MDDHRQALYDLYNEAHIRAGTKAPETNSYRGTDYIPTAVQEYLQAVTDESRTDFYQWFILLWQAAEHLYNSLTGEDDWKFLADNVLRGFENVIIQPKLCAMCISYVYSSLASHPSAQVSAFRIMLHHAARNSLGQDASYRSWILSLMQSRLDISLTNEYQRPLFVEIIIDFFLSLPARPDDATIRVFCHCFHNKNFISTLTKINKKGDYNDKIATLANRAFASSLSSPEIFIFETILDATEFSSFLNEDKTALLKIFCSGTLDQLEKFIVEKAALVAEEQFPVEEMRQKMHKLVFLNMCDNKKTFSFSEIMSELHMTEEDILRFVVSINSSNIAVARIDAVNKTIDVDQHQPRLFKQEDWKKMSKYLDSLAKSLQVHAEN